MLAVVEENARQSQEPEAEKIQMRCERTGNPCGTDTINPGHPCSCKACIAWEKDVLRMAMTDKAIVDRLVRVPSARGWIFSDMDAAYLNDPCVKLRLEALPDLSALRGKGT